MRAEFEFLEGMAENHLENGIILDVIATHTSKVDRTQHWKTHTARGKIRQRGICEKTEGIH